MGNPKSPLPTSAPQALALAESADGLRVAIRCTYCHDALDRGEAVFCATCLAPHHGDCHGQHTRCAGPGCLETRTVRPEPAPSLDSSVGEARLRPRLALFATALLALVCAGGAASHPEPGPPPGATFEASPGAEPRPSGSASPQAVRFSADALVLEARGFRYAIRLALGERLSLRLEASGYAYVRLIPPDGAPAWRRAQTVMVVEPGDAITLIGAHGIRHPLVPSVRDEISLELVAGGELEVVSSAR